MKLTAEEAKARLETLGSPWSIEGEILTRTFTFPDFRDSMKFANRVAEIADELNHHPDMHISYGSVTLSLTTHDAKGLSEKDFELAKRISG